MKRLPFILLTFCGLFLSCGYNIPLHLEKMDVGEIQPASKETTVHANAHARVIPENEPFTIIALPDTQEYSRHFPQIFDAQTRWIVDNKDRLNIVYVFHLGDIVDSADSPGRENEWVNADRAMSVLDGAVPYGVLPGNHDMDRQGVADNYNKHFPVSRFQGEEWWGGNYLDNKNNYQLISASGLDFIMLNLEFEPSLDVLHWARGVLKAHPNRIAILATHSYLTWSGRVYGEPEASWRFNGTHSVAIQNEVVAKSKNLLMVLCGHNYEEASFRISKNASGQPVFEMMSNYQFIEEGGSGYLRIIRFLPEEQKISVQTYSPWIEFYNKNSPLPVYKRDRKNEFEICLWLGQRCPD